MTTRAFFGDLKKLNPLRSLKKRLWCRNPRFGCLMEMAWAFCDFFWPFLRRMMVVFRAFNKPQTRWRQMSSLKLLFLSRRLTRSLENVRFSLSYRDLSSSRFRRFSKIKTKAFLKGLLSSRFISAYSTTSENHLKIKNKSQTVPVLL